MIFINMYHFGSDLENNPKAIKLMAKIILPTIIDITWVNKRAAITKHTPRKIKLSLLFFILSLDYLKYLFIRSKCSSKFCFAPVLKFLASPTSNSYSSFLIASNDSLAVCSGVMPK